MATKKGTDGGDKGTNVVPHSENENGQKETTLEEWHARLLKKVLDDFETAKKSVLRNKDLLREDDTSIREGRGEINIGSVSGLKDSNGFENIEAANDGVDEASDVEDIESFDSEDDEDCNSEDESYLEESGNSDTEESVVDDFEIGVGDGEENTGDEHLIECDGIEDGDGEEGAGLKEFDWTGDNPLFSLGMTFLDSAELRRAIDRYAIVKGVNVRIEYSERRFVLAICEDGCPFRLYASRDSFDVGYKVKSLLDEHMCARVYKNRRASAMWIASHFKEKIQENPRYRINEMKKDLERELQLHVSTHKCKRARRIIMHELEGRFKDEFSKLEAYCNELKVSNPGSDVSVEVSNEALEQGRRVFRRMYVCMNAPKVGWKCGCRPFIGLDGTFLKGNSRGILLTAVGLDANDSLYPIAFGVTDKETTVNWTWFLEWLNKSLDLGDRSKVTVMSDMQKGLTNAVSTVLPEAEHRLYARHIYANWSKAWRGNQLKKRFFYCAWSSYVEQFNDNLRQLEKANQMAAHTVLSYPHRAWIRAFFSCHSLCWAVDNNACESFNAWIDDCRRLPVIRMIDGIRLKMMEKWAKSEENLRHWKGDFSPKCLKLFEANRKLANKLNVAFNGDDGFEVNEGVNRHSVMLHRKKCTCRAWDLTGIPCQHAICAMYAAKIDPLTQISMYYHKNTYLASYRTKFEPVRGKQFWDIDKFLPMLPPPICTLPGRPPTKRVRTEENQRRMKTFSPNPTNGSQPATNIPEAEASTAEPLAQAMHKEKLSRRGSIKRCTFCKNEGHNRSTCKEAPLSTNPRPGRKKKTPTEPSSTPPTRAAPTPTEPSSTPATQTQPTPTEPSSTPATQTQPTPTVTSSNPPTHTQLSQRGKRKFKAGYGLLVDENTGRTVFYDPGQDFDIILNDGSAEAYMHRYADPQTKFPIPNEMDARLSSTLICTVPEGSRRIQFTSASQPQQLAIRPPGLMWQGQPSVSSSHFQHQRD